MTIASGSGYGVTDHSQLTGVVNIEDDYAPEETAIHLTGKAADNLKKFAELEIIESTDTETKPSDKNLYTALAVLTHFLRKDAPDVAEKLLKFLEGAEFGIFESGPITGTDRKSTRLNSSHPTTSRMPSSA